MNMKLAESLAEAVVALQEEEYTLFQQALTDRMVKKTPGVVGGHACIRNTRIAVWILISLMHQGVDDAALLRKFPGLSLIDLAAARSYYVSFRAEIDKIIDSHHREDGWND